MFELSLYILAHSEEAPTQDIQSTVHQHEQTAHCMVETHIHQVGKDYSLFLIW
jgi:hypothetical protein